MNNFDNKIKAKFEDFEPAFQEQDWQSFAPLLHPKIPFWLRIRKPLGYAIAASTVLFLVYQNTQLSIENKQLHSEIKQEKQEITKENEVRKDTKITSPESMQTIDSQTIANNKNTIVQEKIVQSQVRKEHEDLPAQNQETTQRYFDKSQVIKKDKTIAQKSLQQIGNQTFVKNNNNNNLSEKDKNQVVLNTEKEKITNPKTTQNEFVVESSSNEIMFSQNTGNQVFNENIKRNFEDIALLNTLFPVVSNEKVLSVLSPEKTAYAPTPQLTKPNRDMGKFSLGLSVRGEGHFGAVGIAATYDITKHLQVSAGIELAKGANENFRDTADYRRKRKEDFKKKFPQPLPKDVNFTDIRSATKQILLPIHFYYKIPLYRRWVGVASVGSILHLNTTQRFDYQYNENNGTPVKDKFQLQDRKAIFQNMAFSIGVQTSWKRLTLRAEPYYILDFKQNAREQEHNGGFKAQIFYNF